jgi:hypothetical protein
VKALSAIVAFLSICSPGLAKSPSLGDALPNGAQEVTYQSGRAHVLTESGQTLDSYRILRDGIHYIVGVDQKRKIAYITGGEEGSFKTPEGISTDSPLSSVLAVTKSRPIKVPGWGYYVSLPSGWNAAFVNSPEEPTPPRLSPAAKVGFLFKSASVKQR